MEIKSAIFDMDGTLVDSLMLWEILWNEFAKRFTNGEDKISGTEMDRAIRTMPLKEGLYMIHEKCGIGQSGDELLDITNEMMRDAYRNTIRTKKGVTEFLEHLEKCNIKMCLATATAPELLNISLDACGIRKYFSKIFSCKELGIGKEKPDIYLLAQEFLGNKKDEIWVFEDSYVALKTAKDAGFKTVGIYDKHNFDIDKLQKTADIFIDQGESLDMLIKDIK